MPPPSILEWQVLFQSPRRRGFDIAVEHRPCVATQQMAGCSATGPLVFKQSEDTEG